MSDEPRDILKDIVEAREILARKTITQEEPHPVLLARMRSICPPALKVEQATKIHLPPGYYHLLGGHPGGTFISLLITTRDDKRSTYLSIPVYSWVARNCMSGDSCKLAIRLAKRTLYKRHRGTWAERTLARDTWAPMTEGGW